VFVLALNRAQAEFKRQMEELKRREEEERRQKELEDQWRREAQEKFRAEEEKRLQELEERIRRELAEQKRLAELEERKRREEEEFRQQTTLEFRLELERAERERFFREQHEAFKREMEAKIRGLEEQWRREMELKIQQEQLIRARELAKCGSLSLSPPLFFFVSLPATCSLTQRPCRVNALLTIWRRYKAELERLRKQEADLKSNIEADIRRSATDEVIPPSPLSISFFFFLFCLSSDIFLCFLLMI
jgi:hypothetical protein